MNPVLSVMFRLIWIGVPVFMNTGNCVGKKPDGFARGKELNKKAFKNVTLFTLTLDPSPTWEKEKT